MTILQRFLSICALLVLAACGGGGGDAGTPPFSGGPNPNPPSVIASDLVVVLSSNTIANTGQGSVTLTITALDSGRVALPGVEVAVTADNGGVVTLPATTTGRQITNAQGQITGTVGIGSLQTLRTITLTAVSGTVTRSAPVSVVSTPIGTVPTSIELIADSTTLGTGGDGVVIRAFVKDANNNALAAAPVSFSTSTGTLSLVSGATSSAGLAVATISAGADKSNRLAVITVSSGTIRQTLNLPITGTVLRLSGPSSLIRGNAAQFDVVITDSRGNPVPGVTISANSSLSNPVTAANSVSNSTGQVRFNYIATNAGPDNLVFSAAGTTASPTPALAISAQTFAFVSPAPSTNVPVNTTERLTARIDGVTPLSGVTINFAATGGNFLTSASPATNAQGEAFVDFRSASAGPVTVQATVGSGGTSTTIPLNVVAVTPARVVLQVSQSAISPNTSAAGTGQTLVLAKVTDPEGNPVQGQTVNFTRVVDPSGGNLLQASAVTDTNGTASVTYRAGAQSTANNGVQLRATVANTIIFGDASLTVSQSALFIALGTGNTIDNVDPQTYKKDWTIYVTDSNGVPVNGVTLTIKAIPVAYRTGSLRFVEATWTYVSPIWSCRSEDRNQNGVLDSSAAVAITRLSLGATTTLTATNALAVGDVVVIRGLIGTDNPRLNGNMTVVSATPTTFDVAVNTTGLSISVGAGSVYLKSEDDNGDGVLWPGNVIAVSPGTVQTVNGRATITLTYAESYVPWVELLLTASATVVGTESRTDAQFVVDGLSSDFNSAAVAPAGVTSPFGLLPKTAALAVPGACSQLR